jgi:hypothetical protein
MFDLDKQSGACRRPGELLTRIGFALYAAVQLLGSGASESSSAQEGFEKAVAVQPIAVGQMYTDVYH